MRCEEQVLDSRAAVVIAALMIWLTPWTVRQRLGPGLIDWVLYIAVLRPGGLRRRASGIRGGYVGG